MNVEFNDQGIFDLTDSYIESVEESKEYYYVSSDVYDSSIIKYDAHIKRTLEDKESIIFWTCLREDIMYYRNQFQFQLITEPVIYISCYF
jgi:type II restriction/modification system DNA methylase subunit YeeA